MNRFLIGTSVVTPGDNEFQWSLEEAYKHKVRPLCLCSPDKPEMYIARINNVYFLKKMPNSGCRHSLSCTLFDMPSELSGRGSLDNQAIKTSGSETDLKVDFSFTKKNIAHVASSITPNDKTDIKAESPRLGIRALLHYLYEEAGLNKWYPAMAGKRNWFIIRKHLLAAAQGKQAKKNDLHDILLIPEPFKSERAEELKANRSNFLNRFKEGETNKASPMGLLVGEVKSIEPSRYGYKMVIKHMPEKPIFLSESVHKKISKYFANELSIFEELESIHLMVISTFLTTPSNNLQVDTMSLMLVDRNWVPFESIDDLELVERLTSNQRSFIKGMRYNLPASELIASILMTDTEHPTPIYIASAGVDDDYYETLNDVLENSEYDGLIWDLNKEEVLCLPEKATSQTSKPVRAVEA